MKTGDLHSRALWFNGAEQRDKAQAGLARIFGHDEALHGVVFGPVRFYDIPAGDARLGANKPPEAGAAVLVAEAEVMGLAPMPAADAGFIANLSPFDLERLRKATRDAYKKANPKASPLRQDVLDRVIGKLGPDVARRLVNGRAD